MKKAILTTTALVLIAAPAFAEKQVETRTNFKTRGDTGAYVEYSKDAETITKKEVKRTVQKAKDGVKRTSDKAVKSDKIVKSDNEQKTQSVPGLAIAQAKVAPDNSAEHMIGKPVLNAAGERVGSVHDIILTRKGQIKNVIVADGGMMSLGDKKAAFDYNVITQRNEKGALKTSLTEEQLNTAKAFSYKAEDVSDKSGTVVKAADEFSLRDLIGAAVIDAEGKKIGSVKDIAIEGNHAGKVVVAYDQILGIGGRKIGLAYSDVTFDQNDGGKMNLRLNKTQAAQLADAKRAF